jgi:hypothetical protein
MLDDAGSLNSKRNLHVEGAAFVIRDDSQPSGYYSGSSPFKIYPRNIARYQTSILDIGKETKEGSAQKGHTRKCN